MPRDHAQSDEPPRLKEARRSVFNALNLVGDEYNDRLVNDQPCPDGIKHAEERLRAALNALNNAIGPHKPMVGEIPF